MTRYFIFFLNACFLQFATTHAQIKDPVKWSFTIEKEGAGEQYLLKYTATIENTWHLYSQGIPEGGPVPTSFAFEKSNNYELVGKVKELTKAEVKYDATFGMNIGMFSKKAVFAQKIKVETGHAFAVKGTVTYMCCDESQCLPPKDVAFSFNIPATSVKTGTLQDNIPKQVADSFATANVTTSVAVSAVQSDKPKKAEGEGALWGFFLLAFAAGILGVFTPCVYPMIPMTVSFFMRGSEKRSTGIINGLVFGLSIVFIYTMIGVIVAITKSGPGFTNFISTHWIPNTLFFLLFIVFAASFFGMFELVLPGSWATKIDQRVEKGGIAAPFFMALTLVVVSFSCTIPFVGTILVEASKGLTLKPVIGMLGYSIAFALPFVIFAISPVLLKRLSKSGAWLNTVKVVMAFVLLAFSLVFLSAIDSTFNLKLLSREIFLSAWIVIFTLMGFYLLGKIKFAHDSDLPYLKAPRLVLVIAVFTFAIYMFLGLLGARIKIMDPILPPITKNTFSITSTLVKDQNNNQTSILCGTPKYSDFLELPYQLEGYFDYAEGMACAKERNKPVLLDFKGHACKNCKKMEADVWSDPRVLEKLKSDFIIIALYTDDRTKLPEKYWVTSAYDGEVKKTIGAVNLDLEIARFQTNTQPLYVIVNPQDIALTQQPMAYNPDVDVFLRFLEEGISGFERGK